MMQKFLGLFIGLLVLVDAFFIAYAVGINVRKANIVDASLPIKAKIAPTSPAPVPAKSDSIGPVTDTTPDANTDTNSDSNTDSNTDAPTK